MENIYAVFPDSVIREGSSKKSIPRAASTFQGVAGQGKGICLKKASLQEQRKAS
jgi:hypothetical protein